MALSVVGALASLRLVLKGRLLQGSILTGLFLAWALCLPAVRSYAYFKDDDPHPKRKRVTNISPSRVTTVPASIHTAEEKGAPLHPHRFEPIPQSSQEKNSDPGTPATERDRSHAFTPSTFQPTTRAIVAEDALALVDKWWAFRKAGDAAAVIALYDHHVDAGNGLTPIADFAPLLTAEWQKLGTPNERLVSPPSARLEGTGWIVEHQVSFQTLPGNSGSTVRSQLYRSFLLRQDGDRLLISAQSTNVLPIVRDLKAKVADIPTGGAWVTVTSCLESDLLGDLGTSMRHYADSVSYFGSIQTRDKIRSNKERYIARWPVRREKFEGDFTLVRASGEGATARFVSRFRTESAERGEWCEGTVEHEFHLVAKDGVIKIAGQSGRIIESKKGQL